MKLIKIGYTDLLKTIIALVLVILMWMGFAPEWYSWYEIEDNCWLIKHLYSLLDGRWLINIPICIVLVYLVFCWCRKIWIDNDIRLYRPILIIIGLFLLNYKNNVIYSRIVWDIDYKILMNSILIITLLVMVIKFVMMYLQYHKKETNENIKIKGFSDDDIENNDIPEYLKDYARLIANKLILTNIKKQSSAVGITGEWGVGKTTFLKLLKEQIADKAEIVEFNPWMCRTPEQVICDFFSSLRHQLSPLHSTLSKSIKEYAKYLSNITLMPNISFRLDILSADKESLYEKKKNLSEKFSCLSRPVVVFIDDMDRLEREEIFEVLRLIRNTADLINTIYIVAFDKNYVTNVLKDKNIKDASSFLEKIFPIEVHLPKVEDRLVWNTLIFNIKVQDSFNGELVSFVNQFKNNERALILRVLDNYRRAKRFARVFMLNVSYLQDKYRNEIEVVDIFWLELLQMYDKCVYDKLSAEPGILLYRDVDRFWIRNGIFRDASEKDKNAYRGEKIWKEETPEILEMMFGNYINHKPISICYSENYEKYFTLNISQFKLSIREMEELFAAGTNPDEVVIKWIDSGKYFGSIAYQLKQINVNTLNDENLKKFLHGILCFGMQIAPYRNSCMEDIKKMLCNAQYRSDLKVNAHDITLSWIYEKIQEEKNLLRLSKFLHCIYLTTFYDDQDQQETTYPLIISNDEVESALTEVMQSYLEKHSEFTALDILKENGKLAYLFRNCCLHVIVKKCFEECSYKQVAFDVVIKHFSNVKEKPTKIMRDDALGKMFIEKTPIFVNKEDELDYWDYMSDKYEWDKREYFGDSPDKLNEFKVNCFV